MDISKVSVSYHDGFKGTLHGSRMDAEVGEDGLAPYDMLLGGLSGCFYVTFLEIAEKKRLSFDRAEMELEGVHRDGIPRTLSDIHMTLTLFGAAEEDRKAYQQSLNLAEKYCSIHATIAKVAKITCDLVIKS